MTKQTMELAINSGYTAYMLGYDYNPQWTYYKRVGYNQAKLESQSQRLPVVDYSKLWPYNVVRQAIEENKQ